MNSINLFPVKVWKSNYSGDLVKLTESIKNKLILSYEVSKEYNQASMKGDGICSYNNVKNMNFWPELESLVSFINVEAEKYWLSCGYDLEQKPGVFEMWSNVYRKGSFIDYHNHSPIHMTASFYLQQPENGGNICFENPNITLLKHQPYGYDNIRYKSIFENEIEVKSGDLIIFPGWLMHKTLPNLSDEDRIIIGSNICNVL